MFSLGIHLLNDQVHLYTYVYCVYILYTHKKCLKYTDHVEDNFYICM